VNAGSLLKNAALAEYRPADTGANIPPGMYVTLKLPATGVPKASVAVAAAACALPSATKVPPAMLMTGREGTTLTSKPTSVLLPAKSRTVTVSCVVPTGNVMPLAFGSTETDAMPLVVSDAGTLNVTAAPALVAAGTAMFRMAGTIGTILSIFTANVRLVSAFPAASTAWYVIVVVPSLVIVTAPESPPIVAAPL